MVHCVLHCWGISALAVSRRLEPSLNPLTEHNVLHLQYPQGITKITDLDVLLTSYKRLTRWMYLDFFTVLETSIDKFTVVLGSKKEEEVSS